MERERPYRIGVWPRFVDPVLGAVCATAGVGLLVAVGIGAAAAGSSSTGGVLFGLGVGVALLAGSWVSFHLHLVGAWVVTDAGQKGIEVRGIVRRRTFPAEAIEGIECVPTTRREACPALRLRDGSVVRVRSLETFSPQRIGGDSPAAIAARLRDSLSGSADTGCSR